MDPWNQLCFIDLVRVAEFVLEYLPNPTIYGHETCTIGYSRDWGLKGCEEILWQLHQIWSYGPVKSAMFHGFGLGWLICGTVTPKPYKLWTWDLHHWIQQSLRLKRICGAKSPEPYILWARDLHHQMQQRIMCDYTYSWSLHGFGSHPWVNLCRHQPLCFNPPRVEVYIVFMWNGIPRNDHISFTPHPHPYPRLYLYPHNKTLYFMLQPCHTNLTFLLTLYQQGTPYLLILSTELHPVLLSHVLLLVL